MSKRKPCGRGKFADINTILKLKIYGMNLRALTLLFCFAAINLAGGQTVILDFESDETSATFSYFGSSLDGTTANIVANPNPTGINTSANVGEHVKPAGALTFAGAFATPPTPIDVTGGEQVCMKVHFDNPGNVQLKLEASTTGGDNWEVALPVNTAGEWTEVCFDTNQPSDAGPNTPAAGNIYATMVVFFDFGMEGGDTDVTYYFDDVVVQPAGGTCTTIVDHEADETTTNFQYFGSSLDGTQNNIVANPNPTGINTSANVGEHIKPADALTFAGAFANPATPIDVTGGEEICMKVHFDNPGNVQFKLENSTTGGDNWELLQQVSTTGEWTEVCFDTNQPSDAGPNTPAAGNIYSTVVIFFDFGFEGGETDVTYYFDDIEVCQAGGSAVDVLFSVDMSGYDGSFTTAYVSGTFNDWSGTANPLDDSDGDGIWEATLSLAPGVYEYKVTLDDWAVQEEFMGTEDCVTLDESGQFINRELIVSSEGANIGTHCWNSCYACGEAVMITIELGTALITVDPEGMYIAGGGTFGNPGDFPMRDDDGDEVWTITFEKPRDFSSFYTFTNGACPDYSCKEDISGQDCANPDNFNDRFMGPITQDTVIATCFEMCTTDTDDCSMVSTRDLEVDHSLFSIEPTLVREVAWLNFSSASSVERNIKVVSVTGQVVWMEQVDQLASRHQISTANLTPGIYLVYVQAGNTIATQKFIKH